MTGAPPDVALRAVDQVFQAQLATCPESHSWLLAQALALAPARRQALGGLGLAPGKRILDLGCGFGVGVVEAAVLSGATSVGVDFDREVLAFGSSAAADLAAQGVLPPGADVALVAGSVYDLPAASGATDVVISQFVFQHLQSPAAAATEVARVLRPGGVACLIDADDGLSLSHPPASPAYQLLAGALRSSQRATGGDRHIGRKLAGLLDGAGLRVLGVQVNSQTSYRREQPGDGTRQLLVHRFKLARSAIVEAELMTAEQFDTLLSEFSTQDLGPVCEIEGYITVVAARP